jgi:hypothetical protein
LLLQKEISTAAKLLFNCVKPTIYWLLFLVLFMVY